MNSARQHCFNALIAADIEPDEVLDTVLEALAQWYRFQAHACDTEKRWSDSVWYRKFAEMVEHK